MRPLPFIIVMDVLASEVGTRPPWGLLFADDLAICAESSTEVEDELEKWRRVLEENGLKINRKKTEYLRPRNMEGNVGRRKSDQRRINTTEMKMLRWMQGNTRKYHN